MSSYASLDPQAQIALSRRLAHRALAEHGLVPTRVRSVHHGENTTFDAHTDAGRFLVRVHRAGYNTTAEIRSELLWLEALAADGRVVVPRPHRSPAGALVLTLDAPGLDAPRDVVVFHWIPGRTAWAVHGLATFERLGDVTARLHDATAAWQPPPEFVRRERVAGGHLFGDHTVVPVEQIDQLDADERARLSDVRARCVEQFAASERRDGRMLIHADLHLNNVVHHRGDLAVIDFDDAQIAHPLADIAVAIGAAPLAGHERLFDAYARRRPMPAPWRHEVRAWIMARRLEMLGWIADRARTNRRFERWIEPSRHHAGIVARWFDGDEDAWQEHLDFLKTAFA